MLKSLLISYDRISVCSLVVFYHEVLFFERRATNSVIMWLSGLHKLTTGWFKASLSLLWMLVRLSSVSPSVLICNININKHKCSLHHNKAQNLSKSAISQNIKGFYGDVVMNTFSPSHYPPNINESKYLLLFQVYFILVVCYLLKVFLWELEFPLIAPIKYSLITGDLTNLTHWTLIFPVDKLRVFHVQLTFNVQKRLIYGRN